MPDDAPALLEQHIEKGQVVDWLWRLVYFIVIFITLLCWMVIMLSCYVFLHSNVSRLLLLVQRLQIIKYMIYDWSGKLSQIGILKLN